MSHHNAEVLERALNSFSAPASAVADNFTADWVNHDPTLPPMSGLAGAEQLLGIFRTALSNPKVQIEDSIEDGEKVAARFRMTGTHTGPLMGIPATGRPVSGWMRPTAWNRSATSCSAGTYPRPFSVMQPPCAAGRRPPHGFLALQICSREFSGRRRFQPWRWSW